MKWHRSLWKLGREITKSKFQEIKTDYDRNLTENSKFKSKKANITIFEEFLNVTLKLDFEAS